MFEMKSNVTFIKKPELFAQLKLKDHEFYGVIDSALKDHLPEWINSSKKVFWLKSPESQKNLKVYEEITSFFLACGISRSSHLFAIGGGATTDLAGFAAATLLRGLAWTAVPTTLLAMVDGSIGGKVAINTPEGKNLLGAFHAPEAVYICHDFLSSLPASEIQSGSGEVLKYCFLSKKIADLVTHKANLDVIAFECAQFKTQIVGRDFKEQNERAILNLGHTLGHAFESHLSIPHGTAVAMGLRYLLEIFSPERVTDWNKLSVALNLPLEPLEVKSYSAFSLSAFVQFLKVDKKKSLQNIKVILVKEIGHCYIHEMPFSELLEKIEKHEAFN